VPRDLRWSASTVEIRGRAQLQCRSDDSALGDKAGRLPVQVYTNSGKTIGIRSNGATEKSFISVAPYDTESAKRLGTQRKQRKQRTD
jgi:hypothetical protein